MICYLCEILFEGKYRNEADLSADIEKYIKFRICRCKKVIYHVKNSYFRSWHVELEVRKCRFRSGLG